jgi:hypothetical protein
MQDASEARSAFCRDAAILELIRAAVSVVPAIGGDSLYPSKEARQAALDSGMEHGLRETMDQLDQLVASLL